MKKGGGSQKGSGFERDISKQLSLWWTQDLDEPRDDIFWRTSGSGARATSRTKKQKKTAYEYGDITFTDPIGKPLIDCILFECKKGYTSEVDLLDFFFGGSKKSLLFGWWIKAIEEMKEAGRKNCVLIVARNRRDVLVFVNRRFFADQWIDFTGPFCHRYLVCVDKKIQDIVVMRLDDFLNWVEPEDIKQRMEEK
uniref:Uncharacterized protein n=1 Tax=viral metagenome TaxID=1070528 RepID=A0A6M3LL50_9ZZZZ